jgi:PBP1b-binding outer membrane lipoprotein LpoB
MKKLIALLMVSGFAFAFVACSGGSKTEAESTDEPATEETVAPAQEEAPAMDTTAVEADTTATE